MMSMLDEAPSLAINMIFLSHRVWTIRTRQSWWC